MDAQHEHRAPVIPFDPQERRELWPVERINGIKIRLGGMSLEELTALEGSCRMREEDARMDRLIVEDHIGNRFVTEPGADQP